MRARRDPRRGSPRAPPAKPGVGRALDPDLHVAGKHAVAAVLRHQQARAHKLFVSSADDPLAELARRGGVSVGVVDHVALDLLAGRGAVHQGAVLQCGPYPYAHIEDLTEAPPLALVLDGVEDPRNLGAAARAAFALGATLIVIPRDRAASCTASAHKASAGALARIAVARVHNLKRALELLKEKGAWLVGAEADGDHAPWQVDCQGKIAIVVGGEDTGLRRLTREACDHVVAIPMKAADITLNAADAATLLLYEVLRQRRAPVSSASHESVEVPPCHQR
jgi:23S rRNA (guanosine2251-2'-O)-methyltransferase